MKWNILVIRGKKNENINFVSTGEGKWRRKNKKIIFWVLIYNLNNWKFIFNNEAKEGNRPVQLKIIFLE